MKKKQPNNVTPLFIKTNLIGTHYYFSIPTDDNIDYSVRREIILQAYDLLLR